jgi:alpha-glucosidase
VTTWLPQPADWAALTVERQQGDAGSMLSLYRAALRLRRAERLGDGPMAWLPSAPEVLAFRRDGSGFACVVNLGAEPADLPEHRKVLLTSGPLTDGQLPPDTAAWLRLP